MTNRQRKVFAVGVLLASLGGNVIAHLAGCIYRPDAVVKLEIGAASKVETSKRPNVEKDRPTTRPAEHRLETGATAPDAGSADGFSEADRMAIEAGLRELTR